MSEIWMSDGDGWRVPLPHRFASEQKLHDLIAAAPHLLPLAHRPQLTVIASEAPLHGNSADLLAVDDTGKLYIIELKLLTNPEARKSIVAQVLNYAASLRGLTLERLDREVLQRSALKRSLADVVAEVTDPDRGATVTEAQFRQRMADVLKRGSFAMVLVLDGQPHPELRRIAGLLSADLATCSLDLVSVKGYDAGDRIILQPELISHLDASAPEPVPAGASQPSRSAVPVIDGDDAIDAFRTVIADRPEQERAFLNAMLTWANGMQQQGLAKLSSKVEQQTPTLAVLLPTAGKSIVTLYANGAAYVMEGALRAWAPGSYAAVQAAPEAFVGGKWRDIKTVTPELLSALTQAYREAATRTVAAVPSA